MKVQEQEKLIAASREEVTGLRQKLQQARTSALQLCHIVYDPVICHLID